MNPVRRSHKGNVKQKKFLRPSAGEEKKGDAPKRDRGREKGHQASHPAFQRYPVGKKPGKVRINSGRGGGQREP